MKNTESQSLEYSERLRDLTNMIKLSTAAVKFFKSINEEKSEIKFAFKKLQYIHYMPDKLYQKLKVSAKERGIQSNDEFYNEENTEEVVHDLATKIYKSQDNKMIVKSVLFHVYHHAINGRYATAKNYLLMAHIPDIAQSLDSSTQIIYNRVLVQLGLSAFNLGLI
mmetsp:Transcript_17957/g.15687  ORF Transcript_17957/g.15687 Transcript_17957/m.15687 type:complete len:166 (-) Transcript_17957:1216-1713(-)